MDTIVYVVKGAKELLLGLKDGEGLGIIKIQPSGEQVRRMDMFTKVAGSAPPGSVASGGETQLEIDQSMVNLVDQFLNVFTRLGRANGVPEIEIEVDK